VRRGGAACARASSCSATSCSASVLSDRSIASPSSGSVSYRRRVVRPVTSIRAASRRRSPCSAPEPSAVSCAKAAAWQRALAKFYTHLV
jgi:hypothetical protein